VKQNENMATGPYINGCNCPMQMLHHSQIEASTLWCNICTISSLWVLQYL